MAGEMREQASGISIGKSGETAHRLTAPPLTASLCTRLDLENAPVLNTLV